MEFVVQVAFPIPTPLEFTYTLDSALLPSGMERPAIGLRVKALFGRREKEGILTGILPEAPPELTIKPIAKVLDTETLFGPWTLETGRWISRQYFCALGEALSAMLPSARRERDLPELPEDVDTADHELNLSDEQSAAVLALTQSPETLFYLRGITGSGKTEVFLQTAQKVLDAGRQVVYLVPEIALTWQLVETLRKRFGALVAVLHSRLTPSQKLKEWRRIRTGEAALIVGARSAVFAPVANPGLFILDEEHETGYKSGSTPRYHARQVALFIASRTGAKVVLGSATPSIEAVKLMRDRKLTTLSLTKRLAGGAPPQVRLIPLQGLQSTLSPVLVEKIHQTKAEKRQSILFLNRRGFSASFHCRTCGNELKCRNCSVSMTWHKSRGILLCHYCGWQTPPVKVCPSCGSLDVGWSSIGTEHIEEEMKVLFPDLRMARLDSDTAEIKGHVEKTLLAFRAGELDLLLGTQMVAKGLNFPGLKLVGILNADVGLSLPDFRASEKVFGLIRQVSGRAGRFHPDGEVFVQTLRPAQAAIKYAAEGRDEEFWTDELAIREMLAFPPFSRLIRLVFRGNDEEKTSEAAEKVALELRTFFKDWDEHPDIDVLGPAECALSMIAGNHRFQVLLRSPDFPRMHHGLKKILETATSASGVYLEIDVDPVNML